jgi:hypothetical protein
MLVSVARVLARAAKPGVLTFDVSPSARGRQLIAHPTYRVRLRLSVSHTPVYAFQAAAGFRALQPPS